MENNETNNSKTASTTEQNSKPSTKVIDLCYRLKDSPAEFPIKQLDGKMECPLCKIVVKNVNLHFERTLKCGNKIDRQHFSTNFHQYKRTIDKGKIKIYQQRYTEKNPDKKKQLRNESRQRQKEEDPEKNVQA